RIRLPTAPTASAATLVRGRLDRPSLTIAGSGGFFDCNGNVTDGCEAAAPCSSTSVSFTLPTSVPSTPSSSIQNAVNPLQQSPAADNTVPIAVGVTVAIVALIVLGIVGFLLWRRRRNRRRSSQSHQSRPGSEQTLAPSLPDELKPFFSSYLFQGPDVE